jgi:hypothetical protein
MLIFKFAAHQHLEPEHLSKGVLRTTPYYSLRKASAGLFKAALIA